MKPVFARGRFREAGTLREAGPVRPDRFAVASLSRRFAVASLRYRVASLSRRRGCLALMNLGSTSASVP
jgi:hypothetical protein